MSVGAVNKSTGDRIPTAGMPAIDAALSGSSTNPVQNRVVKAALDEKADTDIVASDFSAAASYTAGDYCIYEGKFYKFKDSHSGAWAVADVDEIKIAGELSSLMSGLTSVTDGLMSPITVANKIAMSDAYMSLHDIGFNNYDFATLTAETHVTWFTNWTDDVNFPAKWGSGVLLPSRDAGQKAIFYILIGDGSAVVYTNVHINGAWGTWKQLQFTS